MKTKRFGCNWLVSGITLLLFVNAHAAFAQSVSRPALSDEKLRNSCLGEQVNYSLSERTGLVNFLGVHESATTLEFSGVGSRTMQPDQAARGYLAICGQLFGLKEPSADLQLKQQSKVEKGSSIVKYQQTHLGIPVFAGELNIQLDQNNNIQIINGEILPDIIVDIAPSITSVAAQQVALDSTAVAHQLSSAESGGLTVSEPELWIYNAKLIGYKETSSTNLVWRMMITMDGPPPVRQLVLVDAHRGSVVLSLDYLDRARNRMTYDMNNGITYPGTLRCNEAKSNCAGGDADEVNAHVYARDTYDFYKKYHARDSLDGAGMTLNSHVHYSTGYCNAFWDGSRMTYGDGCSIVADDVVAHEMTHGVTEHESNLVYANQSGAINESFSDIWGEFVDLVNGKGADGDAVKWLIGEDTSVGAFRSLKDPTLFQNPDRMGSPYYYKGTADNGGVHTNSGVGNKAAYLITDGATFNGYTVAGIGLTKTAKIFYKVQKDILTSNATYASLANALSTACGLLVGTSSITTANCVSVRKATFATEMVIGPPPISPSGLTSDKTPTYEWEKLGGATDYQYAVFKGSTQKYAPIVPASACGSTSCTHTPSTVLVNGTYQWKVRAKIGGIWTLYSPLSSFTIGTVVTGFNSQFTSNADGWTPVNGSWSVGGGYYYTGGVSDSFTSSAHSSNYSTLTYEVRMYRTGYCVDCSNGVLIRGTPEPLGSYGRWNSGYLFVYTNSGYFSIWSLTGGIESQLASWTPHTAILQNSWNILKISINSTNGFVQFYINNTLVASGNLNSKPTGQVGITFYRDSNAGTLSVDWATLATTAPSSIMDDHEGGIWFEEAGSKQTLSESSRMAPSTR